jgi:hypothetical protein
MQRATYHLQCSKSRTATTHVESDCHAMDTWAICWRCLDAGLVLLVFLQSDSDSVKKTEVGGPEKPRAEKESSESAVQVELLVH